MIVETKFNDIQNINYQYIPCSFSTGKQLEFVGGEAYTDHDKKQAMISDTRNPTRTYPYRVKVECTNTSDDVRSGTAHIPTRLPTREPAQRRDYIPVLKETYVPMAEVGYGSNLLDDNGHATSKLGYDSWFSGYDDHENMVTLASTMVDTNTINAAIRKYLDQAIRLIISGSNVKAVCHVIADIMVIDFQSDNSPIADNLPGTTHQRSRNGSLTEADKLRFKAYDEHVVWLTAKAHDIVKLAVKLVANAETG